MSNDERASHNNRLSDHISHIGHQCYFHFSTSVQCQGTTRTPTASTTTLPSRLAARWGFGNDAHMAAADRTSTGRRLPIPRGVGGPCARLAPSAPLYI